MTRKPKPFTLEDKWPKTSKETRLLARIHPYPLNPRTHPPAQIAFLAGLLTKYGPDQDIVVDAEDDMILKGHGRRLAAIAAGLKEFPVTVRHGLTEAQKRAMRIEDNQSALMSGWDIELMRGEITSLKSLGYEISALGFGEVELVQFTTMPGLPTNAPATGVGSLAERFGVVPFSVLNAREGWWQDRKRAWLELGIQSEVGRGGESLEIQRQRGVGRQDLSGAGKANAAPGGSPRPSADYTKTKARGDGRGRAMTDG